MDANVTMTAGQTANTEATQVESKTYSQAEVDAMLQSEVDRRITSALKKQESKFQDRLKESERVAKMNEQEKYVYQLEQREKDIAEKEKALALAEMKNEASKILAEKGISLTLVDFVVSDDAETTNANIQLLDKAFKESVRLEVERRLASKVPTKSLPTDIATGMTKDQFKKLSLADLQRLKLEQPEIWAEMTK